MKYIKLALRRNKISQRRSDQHPGRPKGRCSHGVPGGRMAGKGGRQLARNIGNILFFQDCGIKYLPQRNKSYVAVRGHLGGIEGYPGQRYRCFSSALRREPIYEETANIYAFFPTSRRKQLSNDKGCDRLRRTVLHEGLSHPRGP